MSKTNTNQQILINDGNGNFAPIQTGIWKSAAINMEERRRISFTIGMAGAVPNNLTYPAPFPGSGGGFTGIMLIQTTNEKGQCAGGTGTPGAGIVCQPGANSYTGAMFWQTLAPSGTVLITNAVSQLQIDFTDIGAEWFRIVFNNGITTAIGSGTMQIFYTAKAT